MNKIEKCKAARDYHTHGCNCAQSILAAFHEDMGFTEDQCMALAGGMGGGMRCGSICGAISGGILVLALVFGSVSSAAFMGVNYVGNKALGEAAYYPADPGVYPPLPGAVR